MALHLTTGETVSNRYVIKRQLGRGGMATVYEAFDPKLDMDVALKVLPPQLAIDPGFVTRFRREGQTLAKLTHPNILRLYDSNDDETNDLYYLVLELLHGGTLKQRVKEGEPWEPAALVELFQPVAAALDYAHGRESPVIHRDLKPANIMFGERNRPIVSDFGLARIMAPEGLDNDPDRPQFSLSLGEQFGAPPYMAPEQIESGTVGPASDLYALGTIAYELLVGRIPFSADTPMATRIQIVTRPLPLPSQLNPDVDPPMERVLLKALAKDPEHRFSSAGEFVEALAGAAQLTLLLKRAAFSLEIRGSPEGAEVSVDDRPAGRLPCVVGDLDPGLHAVRGAAEGFVDVERSVNLSRDEVLEIVLDPTTHALSVGGEPAGATIEVDGEVVGSIPCEVKCLRPGIHRLTARMSGYEIDQREVLVPDSAPVTFGLVKKSHRLQIHGTPIGAQILVDGAMVGSLPNFAVDLRPGTHEIQVERTGYETVDLQIGLTADDSLAIDLKSIALTSSRNDIEHSVPRTSWWEPIVFPVVGGLALLIPALIIGVIIAGRSSDADQQSIVAYSQTAETAWARATQEAKGASVEATWIAENPNEAIRALQADPKATRPSTMTPMPASFREGEILFTDNFDDPATGNFAKLSSEPARRLAYREGEYVIKPGEAASVPGSFRDSVLNIDVRLTGTAGRWITFGCRSKEGVQRDGYHFAINPRDGLLGLFREDDGKLALLFLESPTSESIRLGTQPNTIQLSCVRNVIGASINGVEVAIAQDDTYEEGRTWFGLARPAESSPSEAGEARFDNLMITWTERVSTLQEIVPTTVRSTPVPTPEAAAVVQPEPEPEAASLGEAVLGVSTTLANVNLRSSGSGTAPIIRMLGTGARVDRLEGRVVSGGQTWQRVRTADGLVGWVLASSITT